MSNDLVKPREIKSKEDCLKYVKWYDYNLGQDLADKDQFWNFWTEYQKANTNQRQTLEDNLGQECLRNYRNRLKLLFDIAREYRKNEININKEE